MTDQLCIEVVLRLSESLNIALEVSSCVELTTQDICPRYDHDFTARRWILSNLVLCNSSSDSFVFLFSELLDDLVSILRICTLGQDERSLCSHCSLVTDPCHSDDAGRCHQSRRSRWNIELPDNLGLILDCKSMKLIMRILIPRFFIVQLFCSFERCLGRQICSCGHASNGGRRQDCRTVPLNHQRQAINKFHTPSTVL